MSRAPVVTPLILAVFRSKSAHAGQNRPELCLFIGDTNALKEMRNTYPARTNMVWRPKWPFGLSLKEKFQGMFGFTISQVDFRYVFIQILPRGSRNYLLGLHPFCVVLFKFIPSAGLLSPTPIYPLHNLKEKSINSTIVGWYSLTNDGLCVNF